MHVILEHVHNVLGYRDAAHEELNPEAPRFAIEQLSCSLAGEDHPVVIAPGSLASSLYGVGSVVEPFFCNYGLNPEFTPALEAAGLAISARDANGEARVVELPDHPFFLAALFVPQARSTPDAPHPLLAGFTAAAQARARMAPRRVSSLAESNGRKPR